MEESECKVCFEEYNSQENKPLVMNCGHTACFVCVEAITNSNPRCPFCKQNVSTNPHRMPINYVLLSIIDSNRAKLPREKPKREFADGAYEGDLDEYGMRTGEGVINYIDGSVYSGSFKANKRHGQGLLQFPDGTYISGHFKENIAHGQCQSTVAHRHYIRYEGMFFNGKPHGKGKGFITEDWYEEGIFVNGSLLHETPCFIKNSKGIAIGYHSKPTQDGVFAFFDGLIFKGKIGADHLPAGEGFSYDIYGNIIIGTFDSEGAIGKGEIKFKNGDKFKGCLLNNKMHGTGLLTFGKDSWYSGTFHSGFKSGYGEICLKVSYAMSGLAELGFANTGDPIIYKYEGDWAKDNKEGSGKETINSKIIYVGQFKNNVRSGVGVLYGKDWRYEGSFLKGTMHGTGKIFKGSQVETVEFNEGIQKSSGCTVF